MTLQLLFISVLWSCFYNYQTYKTGWKYSVIQTVLFSFFLGCVKYCGRYFQKSPSFFFPSSFLSFRALLPAWWSSLPTQTRSAPSDVCSRWWGSLASLILPSPFPLAPTALTHMRWVGKSTLHRNVKFRENQSAVVINYCNTRCSLTCK